MTPEFYRLLHLSGVIILFLSMGGLLIPTFMGPSENEKGGRKLAAACHGIAMAIIFIAGFGLIAKLKYGFQGWVIAKIFIWIIAGAMVMVVKRKPQLGKTVWFVMIILGVAAAFLGGYKPF